MCYQLCLLIRCVSFSCSASSCTYQVVVEGSISIDEFLVFLAESQPRHSKSNVIVQYGLNPNTIGLLQWGDGIVILIGNQLFTHLVDKYSLPKIAAVGALMSALQIGIPLAPSLWVLAIFRYPSMLLGPLFMPVMSSLVAAVAPAHRRGSWLSIAVTVQAGVRALSPILLGNCYDIQSTSPWMLTAAATVPMLLLLWLIDRRVAKCNPPEEQFQAVAAMDSVYGGLLTEYERLKEMHDGHHSGSQVLEQVPPGFRHSREQAEEFGRELADRLSERGYERWPMHLEGVQALALNAFPPISRSSRIATVSDLMRVYEHHVQLNSEWRIVMEKREHCVNAGNMYK